MLAAYLLPHTTMSRHIQSHHAFAHVHYSNRLAIVEPVQIRYKSLDQEDTFFCQVLCHTLKTRYLLLLRLQAEKRIEHNVDKIETALKSDLREVALHHLNAATASFGP